LDRGGWRVVGRGLAGYAKTEFPHNVPDHDQQRSNRHNPAIKPEAPSAAVRSWRWVEWRPKHVEPHINVK